MSSDRCETRASNAGAGAGATSSSAAAIAARFQIGIQQRNKENESLEQAKEELSRKKKALEKEKKIQLEVCQKYLSANRKRDGINQEFCKLKSQQTEYQEQTRELEKEKEMIEREAQALQLAWEASTEGIIADHKYKMELYETIMRGKIQACEERRANRERTLKRLSELAKKFEEDLDCVLQQRNQARSEMEHLSEKGKEENEQVQELALNVRSTIGKVRDIMFCVFYRVSLFTKSFVS